MGKEAAGVMVSVEQRHLLEAVNPVASVVDVQCDGGGCLREAPAEDVHQRRRHSRHLYAGRHVLQAAHGRLRAEIGTALGRTPQRQLEQRVEAQAVAVVGVLVAAGNRQHPKAQHPGQAMGDQSRIAPVPRQPARRSASPRRRSAPRSNTKPPSEEIRPPSNAAVTFLRQMAGRSKGRRISSVMAGVANPLLVLKDV
jgi:hypothetical protein